MLVEIVAKKLMKPAEIVETTSEMAKAAAKQIAISARKNEKQIVISAGKDETHGVITVRTLIVAQIVVIIIVTVAVILAR